MNPTDFCYWLQGFAELNNGTPPTPEQWQSIRDHLNLVFLKITPPMVIDPSMLPRELRKPGEITVIC